MALELAIISVVAGAVLGLRYNALVLVPAVMFATLFALIVGIVRADGFWSVASLMLLLAVAVQLGYLTGIAIYAVIESVSGARGRDRNHELSAVSESTWRPAWHTAPSWRLNPNPTPRLHQPQPPQV
jgi:hypothetical protein